MISTAYKQTKMFQQSNNIANFFMKKLHCKPNTPSIYIILQLIFAPLLEEQINFI